MKIIRAIILLFGFFIGTGCNNSKEHLTERQIDKRIILINIGNSERFEIFKGIEKLRQCSPKIIAINATFERLKDSVSDAALSNSIKRSKNIILPFVDNGNTLIRSNKLFIEGCLAQGIIEMWPTDGVMANFKVSLFNDNSQELVWTFPFAIVNYFDPGNPSYLKETKPNQDYRIKFSQNSLINKGISLDSLSKINCDILKDKIVLMGDIFHNDDQGFYVSTDSNIRVSSTVIFANIISTILNRDFEESKE